MAVGRPSSRPSPARRPGCRTALLPPVSGVLGCRRRPLLHPGRTSAEHLRQCSFGRRTRSASRDGRTCTTTAESCVDRPLPRCRKHSHAQVHVHAPRAPQQTVPSGKPGVPNSVPRRNFRPPEGGIRAPGRHPAAAPGAALPVVQTSSATWSNDHSSGRDSGTAATPSRPRPGTATPAQHPSSPDARSPPATADPSDHRLRTGLRRSARI